MDKFPETLNVDNKNNFININILRTEQEFRKKIYDFLISRKDEMEYLDISFNSHINENDIKKLFWKIMEELHNLGWKTKLSYGNTGLFIYSTENPPKNCW